MAPAEIPIWTSSWLELDRRHQAGDRGLVPVRTSLGTPRWLPWAQAAPYINELAPYGLLKKPRLPADEFERRYVERLEKVGAARIERRLHEVHAEYQRSLALLCFENVHEGEFCHRRVFAGWWEQQTGQQIPEL